MIRYLAGRIGQGAVTVLLVVTVTFVLIHIAPGDPLTAVATRTALPPEVLAQMRRNLGLDRPIPEQYVRYLDRVARGDLGNSLARHEPVTTALAGAIPNTILLALAGLLIEFVLGVGIGVFQATHAGTWIDRALAGVTLTLFSTPVYWLGVMLLFVGGEALGWFPIGGITDPAVYAYLSPAGQVLDRLRHLVLPALTLGLVGVGYIAQHQRSAMLEALRHDFVRTARAMGLPPRRVVRYALRNALLPTIALFGLAFPVILSGAVLVETVFAWPGMGKLAVDAILQRDYPVVMATAIVASAMVVMGSILADLLARLADPRTEMPT